MVVAWLGGLLGCLGAAARLNVWMQNNPGGQILFPDNDIIGAEDDADNNSYNEFIDANGLFYAEDDADNRDNEFM